MKTAMKELIEDLSNNMVISIFERLERGRIFINALEKEKEQIINAWIATDNELQRMKAEEYYNQTYNQDRELPKDVKDLLDNY